MFFKRGLDSMANNSQVTYLESDNLTGGCLTVTLTGDYTVGPNDNLLITDGHDVTIDQNSNSPCYVQALSACTITMPSGTAFDLTPTVTQTVECKRIGAGNTWVVLGCRLN